MTPTPLSNSPHVSRDDWQDAITKVVHSHSDLGSMSWAEVSQIEFLPNVRIGDDLYVIPEHWMPNGAQRRRSYREVPVQITYDGDPQVKALMIISLKRTLSAMTLVRRTETGQRKYKHSTWLGMAWRVVKFANWVAENAPSASGTLWSHLSDSQWEELSNSFPNDRIFYVRRQIGDLGDRGILNDAPSHATNAAEITAKGELSLRAAPAQTPKLKSRDNTYKHFSDEFVTALLSKAIWIHDNLADQLIDCWIELRGIQEHAIAIGRRKSHPTTTAERRAAISRVNWVDKNGRPLAALPWPLRSVESGRTTESSQWPPKDARGLTMMVSVLQALNYAIINFCIGSRSSELLGANDHSLIAHSGRFGAMTFKVVDAIEGEYRDWPLHPVAIRAYEIQMRIARVVRPEEASHIWVLLANGADASGSPLRNINEPLVRAAEVLKIDHLTDDVRPHSHRWRHTIARLVALSVAAAPQVLMDLFGHRDLEMTLRYMLSDEDIVEESRRVADEAARALAEEAIADVEAGNAGGRAAPALKAGLDTFRMKRGEAVLGADSLQEAIAVLTFSGRQWHPVRDGVICTKGLGQFGPCTQGRGTADPGSCRTGCDHRLETARAKLQCESVLEKLLTDHADAEHMPMLQANIEGHILANLMRWDDLREKFVANSNLAQRIWAERAIVNV